MLDTSRVAEYLADVRAFADRAGKRANLEEMLTRLGKLCDHGDGTVTTFLSRDFAPYSFYFVTEGKRADGTAAVLFEGGLIYHGRHDNGGDGGAPTYSVSLSPVDGWSIHT